MSASWNSLLRRRDGSSAVEFTLLLPLLAMLLLGVYETGRLMTQWTLLEKNMRAAGLYLARTPLPLTAGARATAERLIRTGRPDAADGAAPWYARGAVPSIATRSVVIDGTSYDVIEVGAEVPFAPVAPLLASALGLSGIVLRPHHEQPHIPY